MPDRSAPAVVSRSAFLDLREEEKLVRIGYRLLDEKRVQLATEILQQRRAYRASRKAFMERCEAAATRLLETVAVHGIDALQVHPAENLDAALSIESRPFVGLSLITAELGISADPAPATDGVVRECIAGFRAVMAAGVPLAAIVANLERLMKEYQRTERRVRALENVILPEISGEISMMQEQLDLNEQEEVIRVHTLRT